MVAARIANLEQGRPRENEKGANLPFYEEPEPAPVTLNQAADMLNVGRNAVQSARVVVTKATPELVAKVETGTVSVSAAADVVRLPEPEQREIVAVAS